MKLTPLRMIWGNKKRMSPFWSFALSLAILSTLGATVNARTEVYLSPNGKRAWDGTCGRIFAPPSPSPPIAGAGSCSLEDPCSVPHYPISERPCNLHFLPGNYGGSGLYYYPNLYDTPITDVNITLGDMSTSASVSDLTISVNISPDLQSLYTTRLNINSANPSSNVILKNGKLIIVNLLEFNTYFKGVDFIDFPISTHTDLAHSGYPGLLSFKGCNFQYSKTALTLNVEPPREFFQPKVAHFEVHLEDSKISANLENSDPFIIGKNLTELDLSLKNSHFKGGVLLLAQPGGNFRDLKFENSVISTSAQYLLAPSPQPHIGIFNSLEVLRGTRLLNSQYALFKFFSNDYLSNPGTHDRYAEQLFMHDVSLKNVGLRASIRDSSISKPGFKNVNCLQCNIYIAAAGEPYLEGRNHFEVTGYDTGLRFDIGTFTSVFHIGNLSVNAGSQDEDRVPFYLRTRNGLVLDGSLTTNQVSLAPGYFRFLSDLTIMEQATDHDIPETTYVTADHTSIVTLGSIYTSNVAFGISSVSALNYIVTRPDSGIQLTQDLISPGISIHLPKIVHISWKHSTSTPQLNKWYPLANFVDKLPQSVVLDQSGPLQGLQVELALQPFKTGQQAVFRFRR